MKRFSLNCILFFVGGIILSSCTKDSVGSPAKTEWSNVATIDEIYWVDKVVQSSSNIYMMGYGVDGGLDFISIDINNQIVEKRAVQRPYKYFLNKDFYATINSSGNSGVDSTLVKFYSTSLHQTDPIAVMDSRQFRSGVTNNLFNISEVQFTATQLSGKSYGIILRYGPLASTNIDVATIRIDNSTVTKLQSPSNYNGLLATDFIRNDSLFMNPSGYDNDLHYVTDLNNTWNPLPGQKGFVSYFVLDNFFAGYGSSNSTFDFYKVDKANGRLVLSKSSATSVLFDKGSPDYILNFNNFIYYFQANKVYTKTIHAFLAE